MRYQTILLTFTCTLLAIASGHGQAKISGQEQLTKLKASILSGDTEISNYNSACYFALAGEHALAFKYLKAAVQKDGLHQVDMLTQDADFISLHSDPQWKEILKEVAENAKNRKMEDAMFFNRNSFWDSKNLVTAFRPNLSAEEKLAGLSKFWSEAKYNFVNFDLVPALDIDSLYMAYIPKVRKTNSTKAYYRMLSEFCAQLKDGHTNVYPPKELEDEFWSKPLLRPRLIGDKVLIVSIYDPELKKRGINIGDEVFEVNGLPVKEYARKYVTPYASASTPQDLDVRSYEYELLNGSFKEPVMLTLVDEKGKKTKHSLARIQPKIRSQKIVNTNFEFKMLKGNIAHVVLNSFGDEKVARQFAEHFDEISNSNAIIFDVRGNGGGSSAVGWSILRYLINKPAKIHQMQSRLYNSAYRAWNYKQRFYTGENFLNPMPNTYFGKQVVVLTSGQTYSAAEDFAGAFKSLGRGKIIGEATGGSSGQPLMIDLPGSGSARICTKRDKLGDGGEFIGKGIQPDIIVSPTVADFRKGKDTVLEAAIVQLTAE